MGIKQRIQRWLGLPVAEKKPNWENANKYGGGIGSTVSASEQVMSMGAVTLTIHQGLGGRAVVSSFYDSQRDRQNTTLYIISDEQDFVTELGRITATEALKR